MGGDSKEKYLDQDKTYGTYYYLRRIPEDILHFYQDNKKTKNQTFVRRALKTKDLGVAISKVRAFNHATEEYWKNLFLMDSKNALDRYEAAVIRARNLGFTYMTAQKVAELPIQEIVERVDVAHDSGTLDRNAVLGLVKIPELRLNESFLLYRDISKSHLLEKNERQVGQWLNPKKRAIKVFIQEFGNLPINQITPVIALEFRDFLLEQILDGELKPNTGNRYLGNIATTIRVVNQHKKLGLYDAFEKVRFSEGMLIPRPPFSRTWAIDKILAPGALDGLNFEARMVLYVVASTGARLNEICGLAPEDIELKCELPHIKIRPNSIRAIKTGHSIRDLPLCGSALEGMQEYPQGFPRYKGKADLASATINKFLGENGLLETEKHSLYCFRHTFQDALIAHKVQDRTQKDLIGHGFEGAKYGTGTTLADKHEVMEKICFHAPVYVPKSTSD